MIKNYQKSIKAFNGEPINVEIFDSANEVVSVNKSRKITSACFHDMENYDIHEDWHGVDSYDEALELMSTGYQPTVDKLKSGIKANVQGQAKRVSFRNDIAGFVPVVPLALQGVPNSMINSYMRPIKAKVLNVYYDITGSSMTSPKDFISAGQKLLAAIMELEMQGYKFNLYAVQSYWDRGKGADILCTKVKSSNTPLDLKRISFPLTHPAYFRVIGFDWYSKTPHGVYRGNYGKGIAYEFRDEKVLADGFSELFGKNAVAFSFVNLNKANEGHIKEVLTNAR